MPADFWQMRPVDFESKVRGFYRRQEYQSKQTREIIAVIMNVNRDAKSQPTPFSGEQIWPLSIDKKKANDSQPSKLTREEIEEMTAAHFRSLEKVRKLKEQRLQQQISRIQKHRKQ